MPRMLNELYGQPELGFLHAETWFSENVYVNMPPFGLGRAGNLQVAKGDLKSAGDRPASRKCEMSNGK